MKTIGILDTEGNALDVADHVGPETIGDAQQ